MDFLINLYLRFLIRILEVNIPGIYAATSSKISNTALGVSCPICEQTTSIELELDIDDNTKHKSDDYILGMLELMRNVINVTSYSLSGGGICKRCKRKIALCLTVTVNNG